MRLMAKKTPPPRYHIPHGNAGTGEMMTKAGKKMIEGLTEAITMKKLMDENERLREAIKPLQDIIKEDTEEILKLRSALRLIFSCGVQQEDVLSNKYKIVIPEYVLFEVEGLMNEAMGKRDD